MAEASTSAAAPTVKSTHHTVAVGLHEAVLDSPTFRATAAHFAEQIDAVEKWLNGYVSSTSKLLHDILALEETINTYLAKTTPSTDGVIDNDYTFLALKRVGDGSRECWMQLLNSMKRMESSVVEPVRGFLMGDMRNFKEIRKVLEQAQRAFDSTLARYVSQSKTKEPSALREDAFSVYETRKAYLQASMDYCQLAPQVRFTMDKLLVKVSNEAWKEMKKGRDAATSATRFEQEMERVRGWAKEMETSEGIFRRELQIARRDLGENAMTGCKPSRELEDYSTSTVPFLGSRGPVSMQPKDSQAVISEKQGWLFLRTLSGKPARHNWVRRWYYCRDKVFGWLIPGPLGVVQGDEIGVLLCNARPAVSEDRRFCFEVKTKSQSLLLQAETQNELTEWLEVFEFMKKKAFESSMDRDLNASGNLDPAFSVTPPGIPEFSARTLDAHLKLGEEPIPPPERAGTLPVPSPDLTLSNRPSFDVNGTLTRRSITALKQDLAREEGESGREHAARIIQRLDLHRKATFGAGAEAALASSSGSAGGLASLMSASHAMLPSHAGSNSPKQSTTRLPSVDTQGGTLAPLTLAKPPAVTNLSRTAVLTAAQRAASSSQKKVLPSVLANYWGTNVYNEIQVSDEPVLPRIDDDDPVGVVVSTAQSDSLDQAVQDKQAKDPLPLHYPPELRFQNAQFRLLFPNVPTGENLVLVFRAAWSSSSAGVSKSPGLAGDGRIYVTPDNMYFYGQQMGLVSAYRLSLDTISEVTAAPGRECDYIYLHFGQNESNDTGFTRLTIKIFLDELRVLHARLNLLVDDLQAEEPMETEALISALIQIEKEEFERPSPGAESWEEVPGDTPIDNGTIGGRPVRERSFREATPRILSGSRFASAKLQLPLHPVVYEPEDMKELATERHFEISAKSCFHVLFGDKSFVFPKLYFEHRAQQIAQGPWVQIDQGRMRREFQFKVNSADMLGRSQTSEITDYQVIDLHSDHVTYVVTHTRTAWHLPYSQHFKLVSKIVITHLAKTRCKLAIYVRIDWSKSPALSRNLVERQAMRDIRNDAEELAELATDQVRKLGARTRTTRAIQVYGQVGQQTQVVVFSPAARDSSRKQAIKPRTLTALVWETARSFGESAVSSLIMWAIAVLKKVFSIFTANRLILAVLGLSILTNLLITSTETAAWWKERRAAGFMRHLGVGPNILMSKAIYMADLAEATGANGNEELFPHNSTCFSGFQDVLSATDMDSPWEDAGVSFTTPTTRSTALRLRRTRQRLGSYRHDLIVAMRVVNSIEREILQSEWENWLMNESAQCDDLRAILDGDDENTKKKDNGRKSKSSQKVVESMTPEKKEILREWKDKYCGSCQRDLQTVVAKRRRTDLYNAMTRTSSAETAATSAASEGRYNTITALCTLDIPTVKIKPQDDLRIVIGNIPDGSSLTKIVGVTVHQFTQWDETPCRLGRLFFYSFEDEVLIIKYPLSQVHEALHTTLYSRIQRQMSDALFDEHAPYGSATFYMKRSGYLTSAGEGDSTFGLNERGTNNRWPTVVIEAGWSQTKAALIAKAHWWFEASNRAVKVVLLVIGDPLQIQIEKWKASPLPPSSAPPSSADPNRPITRNHTAFLQREAERPKVHPPVTTIVRSSIDTPPNNYRVVGSPLRLEFRDVFLRDPVPPEEDLLLGDEELRNYLGPVDWSDVSLDDLKPFLDDVFSAAQTVAESIPSPSSSLNEISRATETPALPRSPTESSETSATLATSSNARRQSPAAVEQSLKLREEWKEVKVNSKENPFDIKVYKLSAKDGKGTWFARRSVHDGLSYDQWKEGLAEELIETLKIQGQPGGGSIRGIGADRLVEQIDAPGSGQAKGPTSPRDFVTLLLSSGAPKFVSEGSRVVRQFMIVSKPCIHPECEPQQGTIRGQYESIELIREVLPDKPASEPSLSSADLSVKSKSSDNLSATPLGSSQSTTKTLDPPTTIEWLMITRSDPGGSVPRFMIEKGTPPGIVNDAGKFIKWVTSRSIPQEVQGSTEDREVRPGEDSVQDKPHAESRDPPPYVEEFPSGSNEVSVPRYNEEDVASSNGGLWGMVTGAFWGASSVVSAGLRMPFGTSSLGQDEDEENHSGALPLEIEDEEEDSVSDTSSIRTFTSALDRSMTQEEEALADVQQSNSDDKSSGKSSQLKELKKLEERRRKLDEKAAKMAERWESKRQEDKEKDAVALTKAQEKHAKEVAKHEAKYNRELRRIKEKKEQEERKAEQRRKKIAEREAKANAAMELEKTKAERDYALKQVELLKAQVGELQSQNTMLTAKLGRLNGLDTSDSASVSSKNTQGGKSPKL
ncbi:unnamed protein product [Clonostachys rosea]|uniref:Autophagy-related protein 26 n=1 Tax=Bionectria ochroleuca TaxID=29856 RepID=A0ABY6UE37_BIOOC|nr:unnamed protein product [Clonostachys rosea]